jgi:hypothetical protein
MVIYMQNPSGKPSGHEGVCLFLENIRRISRIRLIGMQRNSKFGIMGG